MKTSWMARLAVASVLSVNALASAHDQPKAQSQSEQQVELLESAMRERIANQNVTLQPSDIKIANMHRRIAGQQSVVDGNTWLNNVVWDILNPAADMNLTPADEALREHLGLPKDQGLIVTGLAANASASQAGVQQNDVLLKLDDASLAKPEDLEKGLKGAGNRPAVLEILRGGKPVKIRVQPQVRVTMGPLRPEPPAFWVGISVAPLEPALRAQLKIAPNQGLLATEISKDGPAAKAEVKIYDILLKLAGKPLDSQEKLVETVQANGEKAVPLEVIRGGKPQTIEVTPQRRQPALVQYNIQYSNPQALSYTMVRPGFVVSDRTSSAAYPAQAALALTAEAAAPKPSHDTNAALGKRLDDFDSEIKQLRKAIEELSKTLKDKK
jgi:membrane-associated protease RseP (regulator of RpoE activity)